MPILISIVVSIALSAVSYLLMQRQLGKTQQAAQQATLPDEKDGKSYCRVYGTEWIEDPAVIAMQQTGADPIQK